MLSYLLTIFTSFFSLSTMAIMLLGLCCFLSINPVQSSPVDDDAEEDGESDAGDEEGGDGGIFLYSCRCYFSKRSCMETTFTGGTNVI